MVWWKGAYDRSFIGSGIGYDIYHTRIDAIEIAA